MLQKVFMNRTQCVTLHRVDFKRLTTQGNNMFVPLMFVKVIHVGGPIKVGCSEECGLIWGALCGLLSGGRSVLSHRPTLSSLNMFSLTKENGNNRRDDMRRVSIITFQSQQAVSSLANYAFSLAELLRAFF